jgi:hypothetical protein
MAFILRWPAVLVLLALAFLSFAGALAAASAITNLQVEVQQIQAAQVAADEAGAGQATWLDVGLWAGAGLFFLIAGIRLIRRTQGFWAWLLAFALFGGRWAYAQRMDFDTIVQQFDPTIYMRPQEVVADLGAPAAQVGLLGVVLIVGVLAFIVDAVDRAHWNNQGA